MKAGFQRWLAHFASDSRALRRSFPDEALARIEKCVEEGERHHGAEIQIAIESHLPWTLVRKAVTPRERALEVFAQLRVWDTEANNGVLIYVLMADHAIEIVADRAASAALGEALMQQACQALQQACRADRHVEGLQAAIKLLEARLREAFPLQAAATDRNELPNRPTIL